MKAKKISKKGRGKKKNTSPISCYKLCRIGEKFCTIMCKPHIWLMMSHKITFLSLSFDPLSQPHIWIMMSHKFYIFVPEL